MVSKWSAFCLEYIKDFNGTQAAIRSGYKPRSAHVSACRLLKKDKVQAEISRLVAERQMGPDEVKLRLADQARGDMGDFLDISSMAWQLNLSNAKEQGLTKLIKKIKQRTVTTIAKDGTETETSTQELELYDAHAALVDIGRHHKLFTDKMEHSADDPLLSRLDKFNQTMEFLYGDGARDGSELHSRND